MELQHLEQSPWQAILKHCQQPANVLILSQLLAEHKSIGEHMNLKQTQIMNGKELMF